MRTPWAARDRHDDLRRIRAASAQRISALNLPVPCELETLRLRLGEVRGRPITLVPINMKATQPCGMWVAESNEDLVFFDANTTSTHQEHIILHEFGHIICCHRGAEVLDDQSARILFPNLDPNIVRDMLMRATYDDVQEQEAEVIAYLLSEALHRQVGPVRTQTGEPALIRFERTMLQPGQPGVVRP